MYPIGYNRLAFRIETTDAFADWLAKLRDARAKARILARLESIAHGVMGDTKAVGDRMRELRVHVGPGYRIYFVRT
jgi:putative addiction module killer protein